ncbi:MAG: DUF3800 domain-containing protein [Bacteroidales bacterium]
MEKFYIFGDEFGTHSLNDKESNNISHFIYTAIVIKESNIASARDLHLKICQDFLDGHKISSKSKALRDRNFKRRIDILKIISNELPCSIYCLIVDKSKLDGKGFNYKEVFYKYFQKIFLGQFYSDFDEFEINMHNIISSAYATQMQNYLLKEYPNTLFNRFVYRMKSDDEEPLIQFADIIAGSLGRVFSISHRHSDWGVIYDLLKDKLVTPTFFPYHDNEYSVNESEESSELNKEILTIVQKDCEKFLNETRDKTMLSIVDHLLYMQRIAPTKLVETYELVESIFSQIGVKITLDQLRRHIRDIRYQGIMVVTISGKSGYKLASSKDDIINYFSHYMKYVIPMLQKVDIANNIFKGKTTGEFVPINETEVNALRKLVETLNNPE